MKIVVFGLSITSAWGNGHATTFRALLKALHERKHDIVFFEKETEWYAHNRDLPEPPYCRLILYDNWSDVSSKARKELADADVGMVGSYFPDGVVAIDELLAETVRRRFRQADACSEIAEGDRSAFARSQLQQRQAARARRRGRVRLLRGRSQRTCGRGRQAPGRHSGKREKRNIEFRYSHA